MNKPKVQTPATFNPPPKKQLSAEHKRNLERLSENCYKHLHRPMVVKAKEETGEIWYICQECLDKYVEEHPELKEIIIAFKR